MVRPSLVARRDHRAVDRLAELVGLREEFLVTARAMGEPAQLEPTREVLRFREALERLGPAARARREELQHRVPEPEAESPVACRLSAHRTPV